MAPATVRYNVCHRDGVYHFIPFLLIACPSDEHFPVILTSSLCTLNSAPAPHLGLGRQVGRTLDLLRALYGPIGVRDINEDTEVT